VSEETWRWPASELASAYSRGELSPEPVVDQVLERVARLNPRLNAIVTLDESGARAAAAASAKRWRAGAALGPLDGVPLTVKDNIPVRGMRATWGSKLFADYVPERDELPVARLRAGGAVICGKTNCPEFTLQGYTDNPLFGPTRNPWDLALTPGGSIRRPASHAGLVGLKPTRGRVPRCDGFPAILLDFEAVGPMARTVNDIVLMMRAISDPDPRDPSSAAFARAPFTPLDAAPRQRILFAPTFSGAPVDAEIAASVAAAARALERAGHALEEARRFDLSEQLNELWPVIGQVGLAWLLAQHAGWRGKLGPALEAMADVGAKVPGARYFEALDAIRILRERLGELFASHDLLLTPTAAALPWPATQSHPATIAGRSVGPRGHAIFTALANVSGLPAISVPCTPSASGLPIGLQLVGNFGADALLCAVARQLEQAQPWADRWPVLD
jgi:aspartyl-tRNA(Asn)/glutamyl-tRNA(Gln) amidotransferase subunit A